MPRRDVPPAAVERLYRGVPGTWQQRGQRRGDPVPTAPAPLPARPHPGTTQRKRDDAAAGGSKGGKGGGGKPADPAEAAALARREAARQRVNQRTQQNFGLL